ncbi:Phosphoglycerate kinase [Candidatus Filomicrobium marinum]|uniref:Phosphoglycerate kinase n=1 Tax=Candidatus Filomicrobium marinum TaxID=1608628 RepID=A0A0D6JHW7_9HYPH|nr:phosphoglycerate kinase [Candidatus Filomicrobium marinum]CFX40786.1 Phosphoglycerate kinase [Candidatus Filomicrobium marinum]CPR21262.1 Phosphoglycerate kinase [Candidatus Filomicrobium marinum]
MDFSKLRTTEGLDVDGKRVMVRVDLNVPLRDGVVTDATRIVRIAPCLLDLASRGAKVIVISHFGRPKGKPLKEFSLVPVAGRMGEVLQKPIRFAADCIGPEARDAVEHLVPGDIALFENLRFHPGEEANDPAFAQELARNADIFVGEAFSTSHRAHASTEAITHLLPSYAGPLMLEEINALRAALEEPKRPTVAVVGGAKVSTKIPILTHLVAKVDKLIIGGGMANTFLQAKGVEVGKSLAEPDFHDTARQIMAAAAESGCEILLPDDAVVAREFKVQAECNTVPIDAVPADAMILDVGPKSVAHLTHVLGSCQTLLWNGPLGAFEIEPFGEGTFALARAAAALTKAGALVSVAGGGDTVAALNAAGVGKNFTYVSTAGGAFLEWLEGRELPGVAALLSE